MLKKRVLTVSLTLLCCLCCCFYGFGSVKAFALTTTYPQYNLDINNVWSDTLNQAFKLGDDGVYSSDVSTAKTLSQITIRLFDDNSETDTTLNFPIMPALYDYYIYTSYAQRTTGGTFAPNDIIITDGSGDYEYDARLTDKQHYITRFIDSNANYGIVKQNFVAKLNLVDSSSSPNRIGGITFKGSSGTVKGVQYFELTVFLVPKGDSSAMGNIVNAINNQTSNLGGKLDNIDGSIGEAADDIQQSIEDQYGGDPAEEFNINDIIFQHNDKTGVLSFGLDTTIQMLDLFSPSNAGEAYIRVPGWSMEVQGQTYQIWDEYIFYFDSIEENFPFLVTIMRTFTVAMFYVSIVGYINKVYERNFLAK